MIGNAIAGILSPMGTAAAVLSFDSIATSTVGAGGVSSVSFTSIPATYTHLQIRLLGRSDRTGTTGDAVKINFNSDTASNYSAHEVVGDGATAASYGAASQTSWAYGERIGSAGLTTGIFGALIIDILDYANTNKYKTIRSLGGEDANGSGQVGLESGLWRSTSAISTIVLAPAAGTNFVQYSSFALYGIKGA
jgi:hypothetical protein